MESVVIIVGLVIWFALASVVTAILYSVDKRRSKRDHADRDRPRIAERTLLAWSLAGGWPGGWVAGRLLRHKTQKTSYRSRFAVCVVVNATIVTGLGWVCVKFF